MSKFFVLLLSGNQSGLALEVFDLSTFYHIKVAILTVWLVHNVSHYGSKPELFRFYLNIVVICVGTNRCLNQSFLPQRLAYSLIA